MYQKPKILLPYCLTAVLVIALLLTPLTVQGAESQSPWERVFSQDGLTVYDEEYIKFTGISYGNDTYVAVGNQTYYGNIFTSADGKTWTRLDPWSRVTLEGVKFMNGKFYAYGKWRDIDESGMPYYSRIWESADGVNWTVSFSSIVEGNPQWGVTGLAYGDGKFIAAINQRIYTSTDSLSTLVKTSNDDQYGLFDLAYGNGTFVAIGWVGQSWTVEMVYSQDGLTWTTVDQPATSFVRYVNGQFVIGNTTGMKTSPDGITWYEVLHGKGSSIAYGNGGYVLATEISSTTSRELIYTSNLENDFALTFFKSHADEIGTGKQDIVTGNDGFVVAGASDIYYGSFVNMGSFPEITGNEEISLQAGAPFEYTVETANFNPDLLRANIGYARGTSQYELIGTELPPGISLGNTTYGTPLQEDAPHFTGTPTQEGDWTVMLYAYEDGLGNHLYVKKKVRFHVSAAAPVIYSLTSIASPEAGGTVTGAGSYDNGAEASVTATPSQGYTFVNWTNNGTVVSTEPTYTLVITGDTALTAVFAEEPVIYSLTTLASPEAGGTVTGAGSYNNGAEASVTATPNQGYTFVNWTNNGTVVGTEPTYTLVITGDTALTAVFAEEPVQQDVEDLTPAGGPAVVAGDKIWTVVFNQPFAHNSISEDSFKVIKANGDEVNTSRGYFNIEPDACKMQVKPTGGAYEPGEYTLWIRNVSSQTGKDLTKPVIMRFSVTGSGN